MKTSKKVSKSNQNLNSEDLRILRELARQYNDVQKVRISIGNRQRTMPDLKINSIDKMKEIEVEYIKEMKELLEVIPIWRDFLNKIKGIGPIIGATIIGELMSKTIIYPCTDCLKKMDKENNVRKKGCPNCKREYIVKTIEDYPTLMHLNSYCGLGLFDGKIQKREKGKTANWNAILKMTLLKKFADSIIKCGRTYRDFYDKRKQYESKPILSKSIEKMSKMHIENRVRRYVAKQFLADLWHFWKGDYRGEMPE